MNPDSVPPPGTVLADKYRVSEVLGQGGMGVVLAARHELLATQVAIKVMSGAALEQEGAIPRFLREARAAAGLKSEYVARVTDVGTLEGGRPFMVMELLQGEDLAAILRGDGMSRTEWLDALLQVCAGLAEAHAAGIIHRDLKLSNFFRTRRSDGSHCTKILDFGISKLSNPDTLIDTTTKSSVLLGTPYYMSPEQIRGNRDIDLRSDIWQMGVVLYQAMTGYLPFDGENVGMLFARILEIEPRPPGGLAPDLPEPIEQVITACLDKDVDKRPPSIAHVAALLEPFAGPEGKLAAQRARAMQVPPPAAPPSAPLEASAPQRQPISAPIRSDWTDAPVSAPAGAKPSPTSRAMLAIAGIAAAIALGAIASFAFSRAGGPTDRGAAATSTPVASAEPAVSPSGATIEPQPTPEPHATPAPAATPEAAPSVAPAPTVVVSAPASAAPAAPIGPRAGTPRRPPPPPSPPRPPTPERPTLN